MMEIIYVNKNKRTWHHESFKKKKKSNRKKYHQNTETDIYPATPVS